ncbi:hypothetical protein SESBI_33670 [Sesbania bispinosa]|nr:hypothetical protein SESBI_33670 [Sesbania bispinosa]
MLRQILERVDQLQQQNQTLQQQNQSLQTRMNTFTRGRVEEEDVEASLGEFHPFSTEIAETQFPTDFREPILKDYDGCRKDTFNSTHFAGRQGRGFNVNEDRQKGTAWNGGKYKHRMYINPTFSDYPHQQKGVKGPDLDKRCDYHRAKGHDTENCWTLMNKIEKLIKDGFLGRYVERRRSTRGTRDEGGSSGRGSYNKRRRGDDRHDEKEEPEEIRGVVTTIARGFCGGGEASSARRKYVRSVMSAPVNHKVCFAELDPKEDFYDKRPQPTKELIDI